MNVLKRSLFYINPLPFVDSKKIFRLKKRKPESRNLVRFVVSVDGIASVPVETAQGLGA